MKQCPVCSQIFSDETIYCLSDGTPLILFDETPEQATVIRKQIQIVPPPVEAVKSGVSPVFAYLAGGLALLLLFSGIIVVGLFAWNLTTKNEGPKPPGTNSNSNKNNDVLDKIEKEKANLQEQQSQIEKEKQRLAEERQKLNREKTKPTESPNPTITSTPTTSPDKTFPPQPTARIKFGRGRVAESVSGVIYSQRSFVLEARSGQYLSASVNGGSCITFSNGGTSLGYATISGDNRINLINNCNQEARFSLTVSIR